MRSHSLCPPRPAVLELATPDELDALDASQQLADALQREHGLQAFVELEDDCLVLPAPHRVYRDGRTLRGDEYEPYASAVLAVASRLPVRVIRFELEQLVALDWDAFDERCWSTLSAAYASLPGWLEDPQLPRWFGRDERKGPCLSASVEPPGLHVWGRLEAARFDDWHARLLDAIAGLPARSA